MKRYQITFIIDKLKKKIWKEDIKRYQITFITYWAILYYILHIYIINLVHIVHQSLAIFWAIPSKIIILENYYWTMLTIIHRKITVNTFVSYTDPSSGETIWYEPRDINHICFNENVKKILLKLSKDISIHATLKKNEVSCYKFLVDYNLE